MASHVPDQPRSLSALPGTDLPIAWKAAADEIAQQHKQNDYRTKPRG